ncbi:MAG: DegT/DnrJ/EryC1/StrS family aminotransferase, partial [Planctomycetota bacterium]
MSELELRQRIHELVRGYVAECGKDLPGGVERGMPLVESTIGPDEISAVIDVLLDGRITMGPRVFGLEDAWSLWLAEKGVGAMRSLMVNSGSSANLLAMSALASPHVEGGLRPGDEVLVPAVGWSTTVYPIAQVGCVPVLVDVDLRTLNVNAEILEAAISERTRAIVVVHALGNPCPMDEIMDLAEKHGLFVLEDCCEAHGAEMNGRRVGTFGDLSSFSFYFSHHMTTGEGGMLSFHDVDRWHDVCVSLRAHGWIMGRIDHEDHAAANPEIDPRWLFVSPGYNLRSTDLTAAIGLVQLEKLDGYVENRERIRAEVERMTQSSS